MAFAIERVGEAYWPEGLGISTAGGGMLVGTVIDSAIGEERPYAQWITTAAGLGAGVYMVGAGKAPEFGKGLLLGETCLVFFNALRYLYTKVSKKAVPGVSEASDILALVPKSSTTASSGGELEAKGGSFFRIGSEKTLESSDKSGNTKGQEEGILRTRSAG